MKNKSKEEKIMISKNYKQKWNDVVKGLLVSNTFKPMMVVKKDMTGSFKASTNASGQNSYEN